MGSSRSALVMLETWYGAAPDLYRRGIKADIGALAEALVLYDRVYVNLQSSEQLYPLLEWFAKSGGTDSLTTLLESGDVYLYYYNFYVNPIYDERFKAFTILNMREEHDNRLQLFRLHVLGDRIADYFPTTRRWRRFNRSLTDGTVVVEADQFGLASLNAEQYIMNCESAQCLVQHLCNALGTSELLPTVPHVTATKVVDVLGRPSMHFNVDLDQIGRQLGAEYSFGNHTPIAVASIVNRALWSAAMIECDIYTTAPMFDFLCDRETDMVRHFKDSRRNLRQLTIQVDFPDIREEVNSGRLSARDVLRIREVAASFRQWFHEQTDCDREIVQAYFNDEVNKFGLSDPCRKVLKLALLSAVEMGAAGVGAGAGSATGAVVAAGGAAVARSFLTDLYDRLLGDWKPKVIGKEIRRIVEGSRS